jgi:hypothetical protein
MITGAQIKERLNRKPFRPVRIYLSDGSKHDVPHPEFAWVFGSRIFIGVPGKGTSGANGSVKELAVLHVTRLEEAPRRQQKK